MTRERHPVGGRDYPRTLQEFDSFFPNEEACAEYLRGLRWPHGFVCPGCGERRGWATSRALLACMSEGDVDAAVAALEEAGESGNTPQVRYYLWKATGKHGHLAEAKRLLDFRVEHAPEEYRESMLKNVRLHREIMEAWEEHGSAAAQEVADA